MLERSATAVTLGTRRRRLPWIRPWCGSSSRPTTRPRTSRRVVRRGTAALERRRPARTGSSSSTTTRPTGPGGSPTALAAELPRRRGPAPPRARGPRPRLPRRLRPRAARAAPSSCSRWTPTSPTTRRTSRACSRRRAATPTSRSARATCAGGAVPTGASCAGSSAAAAAGTPRPSSALPVTRPHRRLQVLPRARCSRRSTCRRVARTGYAFQVELTYRAAQAGLPRASRCRSSSATACTGGPRCRWRIALEAVVARAAAAWAMRGRALGVHMRALSHMR